jgi:hypothetical protein
LRDLPSEAVLARLAMEIKPDPTFTPIQDVGSRRPLGTPPSERAATMSSPVLPSGSDRPQLQTIRVLIKLL